MLLPARLAVLRLQLFRPVTLWMLIPRLLLNGLLLGDRGATVLGGDFVSMLRRPLGFLPLFRLLDFLCESSLEVVLVLAQKATLLECLDVKAVLNGLTSTASAAGCQSPSDRTYAGEDVREQLIKLIVREVTLVDRIRVLDLGERRPTMLDRGEQVRAALTVDPKGALPIASCGRSDGERGDHVPHGVPPRRRVRQGAMRRERKPNPAELLPVKGQTPLESVHYCGCLDRPTCVHAEDRGRRYGIGTSFAGDGRRQSPLQNRGAS